MLGYAHAALGFSLSVFLLGPSPSVTLTSVIYSKLPDFDLKLRHRKSLHNVFAMLILTSVAFLMGPDAGLSALVAYSSHLLGDSLTVYGIYPFYPFSNKRFRLAKFKSSSPILNLGAVALSAALLFAKFKGL
ncbi:hypothetical protein EYM_05635 [Ignicoccus islandicus DSM 13165]|uniref:Metal-dependent hydrolase n=1 Tax=Ignicoccus islandicus DSM 13165 TaxID=940295 RepID=A0A0U2MB74_9CREN|nr:metal-dependent hydrolase [Ignicoccus islandicus]ALU12605.1 hypothetical protein EYM_05635 [Ignicoccus islandicus DSM 13165]